MTPCKAGCVDGACKQAASDPCASAQSGNGPYCGESLQGGTAGTLYTPEWSWVRDRHIVAVATLEHVPELEAVRRAVLREYRATSLNEASIVQRMIVAIRSRARETGES